MKHSNSKSKGFIQNKALKFSAIGLLMILIVSLGFVAYKNPNLFKASVSETCGNGTVDAGEECDDGNQDDTDGCLISCTRCGDGFVRADYETCDDGNTQDGDHCSADCYRITGSDIDTDGDGIMDDGSNSGVAGDNKCGPDSGNIVTENCDDNCISVSNPNQEDSEARRSIQPSTGREFFIPEPDGVGDACDNCEARPNADQANCDHDDEGDACDLTPDGTCGDRFICGAEVCDDMDVGTETCVTQGFDGGTLACNSDCDGFDTSACTGVVADTPVDQANLAEEAFDFVTGKILETDFSEDPAHYNCEGSGPLINLIDVANLLDDNCSQTN